MYNLLGLLKGKNPLMFCLSHHPGKHTGQVGHVIFSLDGASQDESNQTGL